VGLNQYYRCRYRKGTGRVSGSPGLLPGTEAVPERKFCVFGMIGTKSVPGRKYHLERYYRSRYRQGTSMPITSFSLRAMTTTILWPVPIAIAVLPLLVPILPGMLELHSSLFLSNQVASRHTHTQNQKIYQLLLDLPILRCSARTPCT
jgi:hypothetical protein